MSKHLTISIVTYNSADIIAHCLQSLKHQTFDTFSVIVVDNNSTDDTVAIVKEVYPEARIVTLDSNIGFGAAHNIAIHASDSEYHLVLNPDCTLKENAIRRLINAAEVHEDAASISPCILRPGEESIVDSTGLIKTIYGAVYDRGANKPISGTQQQSDYIWGVTGACALYRRSALESIKYKSDGRPEYFDELFFMYKEDVDLAARFQRAGWKSWYQHDAYAYHTRSGRPANLSSTRSNRDNRKDYINKYSYANHILFLVKNSRGFEIIPSFFYECMKFLYLLIFETRTLAILPSVIRSIPDTLSRRYE